MKINLSSPAKLFRPTVCFTWCKCLVGAVVTVFALGGCEEWDSPLSAPQRASFDSRLIGNWKSVGRENVRRVEIKSVRSPWYHIVCRTGDGKHREVQRFDAFCTVIHGKRFLNLKYPQATLLTDKERKENTKRVAYWFLKYKFDSPSKVTVEYPRQESLQNAVKSKELKGWFSNTTWGSSTRVTDTSQRSAAHLTSDKQTYEIFGVFTRQ